jgi:ketosteroid isomerase-like protein
VQTLEAKRSLADLDKDLLHERVVAIFAHLEDGNIDRMLDFATDDVVCFPPSTWSYAVYSRRIVGKAAVREALRQRDINYDRMISTVHRIIIDGDEAAVHRTTTIRERGSGALHTFDCVNFLRFRDGLVSEFQEFPDGSAYDAVINFPH